MIEFSVPVNSKHATCTSSIELPTGGPTGLEQVLLKSYHAFEDVTDRHLYSLSMSLLVSPSKLT